MKNRPASRLNVYAMVVVAMCAVAASEARADRASAELTVSVKVMATCSIASGGLAFGVYDPLSGAPVDGLATVSVACTQGASATVTLSQGQHAAVGSTDAAPLRRMSSDAGYLAYTLHTDAGRQSTWGSNAASGRGFVAANAAPIELTVYGRIAANQDVRAGSFSDIVVATTLF